MKLFTTKSDPTYTKVSILQELSTAFRSGMATVPSTQIETLDTVKSAPSQNGLKMKVKSASYFKLNKKKCINIKDLYIQILVNMN
jgi:hypothetical protein